MATADPMPEVTSASERTSGSLLVVLAAMPGEQLEAAIDKLGASFDPASLLVAVPDGAATGARPGLKFVSTPAASASWTLTAADFARAQELAEAHNAGGVLMLGPECGSLGQGALQGLADTIMTGSADLAMPRYDLPSNAGLVNTAILYPLTRALFASRTRFPLAVDLGLSRRMAARMAGPAQRLLSLNQAGGLLWPVNEAAVAGFAIVEVDAGMRTLPRPPDPDIGAIMGQVAGSLFTDIDAKAAFWQRPRQLPLARSDAARSTGDEPVDIGPMLDAFRFAYGNLQEIWSLVLPPNSLLGLKRLAAVEAAAFRMPDSLWARIVYDFLVGYRLRTINRGHLLGALVPLYLAWVASHLNIAASSAGPEALAEALAAAFEADKSYLVARWRWPDRFNP